MRVYSDVCTPPGSPATIDTTTGGWLCRALGQIEFTTEDNRALSEAATKGSDILPKISERIGRDGEPVDTCMSQIAG